MDDEYTMKDLVEVIGYAARHLGSGDADTRGWGAIENHADAVSKSIIEAGQNIESGLELVAASITNLAQAIRGN